MVDADRLIAKPVGIRFQGIIHTIKPMSQKVFIETVDALAALDGMKTKPDLNREQLDSAYARLFARCSDTLGKFEVVSLMTDAQKGAVLQQIIECVTGRVQDEDDQTKKKTINHTLQTA